MVATAAARPPPPPPDDDPIFADPPINTVAIDPDDLPPDDPPEPEPPPPEMVRVAEDPPPPPRPDPRSATLVLAQAGMSYASDRIEPLREFGPSGQLGLVHLSHRKDPGFEVVGMATGAERGTSYSATVRVIITPRLRRGDSIRPFLSLGSAFAIARLEGGRTSKQPETGLAVGPSGALGVHGFLSDNLYWRASAQLLGAGVGLYTADVGLGWVVGK